MKMKTKNIMLETREEKDKTRKKTRKKKTKK